MSESNPLVERVDALLKRHQQQHPASPAQPVAALDAATAVQPARVQVEADAPAATAAPADDDIPVLTEVVEPQAAPGGSDAQGRLAEGIEAAVLERVLEELDRSLEMRLNRTIAEVVDQALDGLRVDLADRVRHLVREAVDTALSKQGIGQTRPR